MIKFCKKYFSEIFWLVLLAGILTLINGPDRIVYGLMWVTLLLETIHNRIYEIDVKELKLKLKELEK